MPQFRWGLSVHGARADHDGRQNKAATFYAPQSDQPADDAGPAEDLLHLIVNGETLRHPPQAQHQPCDVS